MVNKTVSVVAINSQIPGYPELGLVFWVRIPVPSLGQVAKVL